MTHTELKRCSSRGKKKTLWGFGEFFIFHCPLFSPPPSLPSSIPLPSLSTLHPSLPSLPPFFSSSILSFLPSFLPSFSPKDVFT